MIPYTVGHVVTVIAVPLTPGTTAVNSYSLFPLPSSTLLQGWVQAVWEEWMEGSGEATWEE